MRRFREQNDISQPELGSMLGVSQGSISAYEAARTKIPEDVFAQLVEVAKDRLDLSEEQMAEAVAAHELPPDIPPEVMDALKTATAAAEGDETAAAKLADTMREMQGAMLKGMSPVAQSSVTDVQLAYTMLAKILGRIVDPSLGELIDQRSGELAVSVVQAAEASPLLARIVAMLKVGPISSCVVMHIMLLVDYDRIRQERARIARAEAQANAHHAQPEPMPASFVEQVDPSMGAFGAATATAA